MPLVGSEAVVAAAATSTAISARGTGANAISLGPGGQAATVVAIDSTTLLGFAGREDLKKQRQLEEARKSGIIPAEKDEEGKDINPHIPQYIAKAPWYLSQDSKPSLKHQRYSESAAPGSLDNWYKRGLLDLPQKIKFRPGSCDNCGALTHSFKECTERPRKKGAKWTGSDLRPDEVLVADSAELNLDFDGKRDRYGGYDPATYRLVIREFELADIERKKRKAQELKEGIIHTNDKKRRKKLEKKLKKIGEENISGTPSAENADKESSSSSDDDDDDEAGKSDGDNDVDDDVKVKEFDMTNAPVGMKDDRTRTTTMNLRIREDTAKYLFNLDVNSAFYDPKSRSMRDNPLRNLKESEQGIYRGDNAMRTTGEANSVRKMEIFSWEAYKHDVNVHSQAQPTQLELMHKEFHRKQQELVELKKKKLLEKYGGERQPKVTKALLFSQTEIYQEYNPLDGSVKRVGERVLAKSKYNDDATFGDHSEVWGSWFDQAKGEWGYLCCKQLNKSDPECREEQTVITT